MKRANDFVLVRAFESALPYDFYISTFPVALSTKSTWIKLGKPTDVELYRATWLSAIRFCNRLSKKRGLPPTYNRETGDFLTETALAASGFRLPTALEWEYAAKGWSGARRGNYIRTQQQHYKTPERGGYSRVEALLPNELGLHGMLVYATEWCHATTQRHSVIHWEEYYRNYDNDIGYQTTTEPTAPTERNVFRVVLPRAALAATSSRRGSLGR